MEGGKQITNLASVDTGKKAKYRVRNNARNLLCKKIVSQNFLKFKKELKELCEKYDMQVTGDREWDKSNGVTYIPIIKSYKIKFGKLVKHK